MRKNDAMKTVFLLLSVALVAVAGCTFLDPPLPLEEPGDKSGGGSGPDSTRRDTVYLVSAISFPDSYDWQRDTAFGAVNCTLELYEGANRVLSLPAGPSRRISAAPDRHHIIDRRLYSDYCDRSGTTLKCNGKVVAEWEEQEIVTGILPMDGRVYTLGRSASGSGYSFRRDGRVILQSATAVPLGGFGMDTYGPTGALYMDKGSVCFSCRDGDGVYLVKDGVAVQAASEPGALFLDAKALEGKYAVLYKQDGFTVLMYDGYYVNIDCGGTIDWLDGGIFMHGGEPAVTGRVGTGAPEASTLGVGLDGDYTDLGADAVSVFFENGGWRALRVPSGCYFLKRDCAALVDGGFALALTPKDGGSPFLEAPGFTHEYKLHGFLSGVAVDIREYDAD